MARTRQYQPLRVLSNNRLLGYLSKEAGGAIEFRYAADWLAVDHAIPVSLSLPLREDAFRGAPVVAVFENLLPDSTEIRRRMAEKVGADGTDAFSLLTAVGRDCVGALQFVPGDEEIKAGAKIGGEQLDDAAIETLLKNLKQTPLGLNRNDDFRMSVAGAQEKTALLFYKGEWLKPHGTTPTTHLFKPKMGTLANGIDLSNSVENEFYCLKLLAAFGLPVNSAAIKTFGKTRTLVIERFDRRWASDGRLLRLPMEDCCQALSCPPHQKYQADGGPGMADILTLLKSSDTPAADQKTFLKAQILFWLIGATDGHAKNFSIFLGPAGRFFLAPIYDVLTAQPSLDSKQILKKQMKLAMFVGTSRHYAMEYINGPQFVQTAERARISPMIAQEALQEIAGQTDAALSAVAEHLPLEFPEQIHDSVVNAIRARAAALFG